MPVRLVAPISGLSVTSARPTFAWSATDAPEGALVQVCADAACGTVEAEWRSMEPRTRAPMPLAEGIHFWRVLPVRGGAVDRGVGAVWLFEVPRVARALPTVVGDIDGDGLRDTARVRTTTVGGRSAWAIEVDASTGGTRRIEGDEAIAGRSTTMAGRLSFVGDVNGDGIGDLLVDSSTWGTSAGGSSNRVWHGGRTAFATVPWNAFAGATGDASTRTSASARDPVGDFDGDGFGDLAFTEPSSRGTRIVVSRGGRGAPDLRSSLESDCDLTLHASGDFNGDGRTELVVLPCLTTFRLPATYSVWAYGRSTVTAVPPCDAPRSRTSENAVVDRDMDGFDDLQIGGYLYRGGPDGLSAARCETAPTP